MWVELPMKAKLLRGGGQAKVRPMRKRTARYVGERLRMFRIDLVDGHLPMMLKASMVAVFVVHCGEKLVVLGYGRERLYTRKGSQGASHGDHV